MEPKYSRILLKLSGEALMGDDAFGINRGVVERIVAHGAAPLSAEDLRSIWEALMAATRRAEERHR